MRRERLGCFCCSSKKDLGSAASYTRETIMSAAGVSSVWRKIKASLGSQGRTHLARLYQTYLDKTKPYTYARWGATTALLVVYLLRTLLAGGWYIITYALGIYVLNLLVLFLSPKFDPEAQTVDDEEPALPSQSDDEFKPFIRKLFEFKFWHNVTRAIVIAFIATLFPFLDLPVFWPILLVYWFCLAGVMLRKQIQHMLRHNYVPFDIKKPKYGNQ
ncbi:hypothetical protein PROFUN_12799 [Planoprotostelium fungivorum]|uniref:Protein RER1 n=1 Tax=Planoprotostelium fungivorum TaxID=1890364 RepID=A0A2P6N6N3_9EUKA|nr:hypothetical protein PROFUN_12799 [Planoprotostelium fungivorum]